MSDGIAIIRYVFNQFLNVLFNNFTIANNVSVGWVMVAIIIIAIMISNILSLAKNSTAIKHEDPFEKWNYKETNWRSKW